MVEHPGDGAGPHAQAGSSSSRAQQQPGSSSVLFIDATTGKHVASHPDQLLSRRCFTWSPSYGWRYDVWIDDPGRYALTGAHSRFAIPSIASRVGGMAQEGWQAVRQARLQELLPAAGERLRALQGGGQGGGRQGGGREGGGGQGGGGPNAAAAPATAAHGEAPPGHS